ncbi:hypothetical protein [Halomonas elongata]|uniref:DUF2842 domain-containing protein n=1 Tax=Halomonas elongata (strain ATCC 33173 / DSM 2581 / NBRC 15536 / NCIMB 2198 / 1H9) TaxID=768066 RepID=A0ABZ0T9W2_HALED|nr:hypothetical protein [Halomonas elongata]WBF19231.1 hypothetical protein LM502_05950 [Halomonas elongata]WPU48091.1 hypothetical protein SR933_04175 [Halomonas elongata DSM 2581]
MKGEPINLVEAYFSAVGLGFLAWAAWQSFTTGLMPVVWALWLFLAPLQAGFVVFFIREFFKGRKQ